MPSQEPTASPPPLDPMNDVTGSYERMSDDERVNMNVVLGAYRSFRGERRKLLAYVSMPITTGKRFFETLTANGVTSAQALAEKLGKDALYELVIRPNIDEGVALADRLGFERKDRLFIAPSVFEAKKWRWSQDAYMSLWYRVIGELAGAHYLMDGWEYSTGGVKEALFTFRMQWSMLPFKSDKAMAELDLKDFFIGKTPDERKAEMSAMRQVQLYAADGQPIFIDKALSMIVRAALDLRDRGLPYADLLEPAKIMRVVPFLCTVKYGMDYVPYGWQTPRWQESEALLRELDAAVKP